MTITYKCPNCGSTDHLFVTLIVDTQLLPAGGFKPEPITPNLMDSDSDVMCRSCYWVGEAVDLAYTRTTQ